MNTTSAAAGRPARPDRARRPVALAALAPLLLGVLLLAGACSSSGNDSAEPASLEGDAIAADAPGSDTDAGAAGDAAREAAPDAAFGAAESDVSAAQPDGGAARPPLQTRAVISTGTVTLASEDVGDARFDVQKIVDGQNGEVTDEQTATDDDGKMLRSRLVIRVPSAAFDATMDELEDVAGLRSAKRSSDDVTTEVIDTDVRVRAQEQSLERVEVLLARARSIRAIVAIEAQLTRRQAELDSLKSQQAYLADQTTLSTITVFLERTPDKAPPPEEKDDETGFLAGLERGWDAMVTLGTGAATAFGAVLPFLLLVALLGIPTWLVTRGAGRRRHDPEPAA